MKVDTEIRHVTEPGANLFLELGFTPDEAKRLQAASHKQMMLCSEAVILPRVTSTDAVGGVLATGNSGIIKKDVA